MSVQQWSKTAINNQTADPGINWQEGQAPSSVNDSARAMMAALASYRDDIAGKITTSGTSTAYTLSTNQGIGSTFYDGMRVAFRVHVANGTPVTLAVDATSAKPLRYAPGLEIPSGFLNTGALYTASYVAATGEWLLSGVYTQTYTTQYSGGSNIGLVPAGGTSTTFLRGDAAWATPPIGAGGAPTSIASASTTDLGTASANSATVTGSATITSFGSSAATASPFYFVKFTGSPTITYNASSLITPTAQNIAVQAGDCAILQYLGSGNWSVFAYFPVSNVSQALIQPSGKFLIATQTVSAQASITFSGLPADAQEFELELTSISLSASCSLGVQYSVSSSFITTGYYGAGLTNSGGATNFSVANGSSMQLSTGTGSANTGGSANLKVNGAANGQNKGFIFSGNLDAYFNTSSGYNASNTGQIDQLKLIPSSGTISALCRLYKIK